MSAEKPVDDLELLEAWKSYKSSKKYTNSFNWAQFVEHRDGSMWAAFYAGYQAALAKQETSTNVVSIVKENDDTFESNPHDAKKNVVPMEGGVFTWTVESMLSEALNDVEKRYSQVERKRIRAHLLIVDCREGEEDDRPCVSKWVARMSYADELHWIRYNNFIVERAMFLNIVRAIEEDDE